MPNLSGEYSAAEMMAMQRDAEARVREMQKRARRHIDLPPPEKASPSPAAPPLFAEAEKKAEQKETANDLFSSLVRDDRLLILLLALILYKNEADPMIILALLYLL